MEAEKGDIPFPRSCSLPVSRAPFSPSGHLREGLNHAEHHLERLPEKDEAQVAPWKMYHAGKMSIVRTDERVIIVMIRFPCTSQIRCVNIINISLCSTDFQQVPPSILFLRKDNKLALISFPAHWSEFLLSPLCEQEGRALLDFS